MVIHARNIPSILENDFRSIATKNFGIHKATLSNALIEALEYYTYNQDQFKAWKMNRKIMKMALKAEGFPTYS